MHSESLCLRVGIFRRVGLPKVCFRLRQKHPFEANPPENPTRKPNHGPTTGIFLPAQAKKFFGLETYKSAVIAVRKILLALEKI